MAINFINFSSLLDKIVCALSDYRYGKEVKIELSAVHDNGNSYLLPYSS